MDAQTREPVRILHKPAHRNDNAIAVVIPVGPRHDPIAAIDSSNRAAQQGRLAIVHIIVLNGTSDQTRKIAAIRNALAAAPDSYLLASINADVGYVRAVRWGLDLSAEMGLRTDRVGFLDADAVLRSPQHWAHTMAALDEDPNLDAISGLVVHAQCQVWEALSSAAVITALEVANGTPVNKPYIQGGAGGSLARRDVFTKAVNTAAQLNTLIGPTLSATSIASGRHVRATSALPCGHTPRRSIEDWSRSVTAYEQSWRRLLRLYGPQIETPWRTFLDEVQRGLRDRPDLLLNINRNTRLRRDIVDRVEAGLDQPGEEYTTALATENLGTR